MAIIFHKLLTVEEAIQAVENALGGLKPLGVEIIPLERALGRVLAENVYATIDLPPFDRSEVDGYAVDSRSTFEADEDKPVELKIVGTSIVGKIPGVEVNLNEAVEIDTGAPLPRGADAVVMVEHTKKINEKRVLIYKSVHPGENVAQTGSDIRIGERALRKGTLLNAREIAVLAGLGIHMVRVYVKPRIAIISTGDEIVMPGSKLGPAKVYDVNGFSLSSMVAEMGAQPSYLGVLPDDPKLIEDVISRAYENYDVVITSGGTSAGIRDTIYRVFNNLGKPGLIVHGLKIKPGKPTIAAVVNNKLLFGLPGFPLSSMVAFLVFVRPILAKIIGLSPKQSEAKIQAEMAFKVQTGKGKREYLPVNIVQVQDRYKAYPLLASSGSATVLAFADGFIEIPESHEFLEENESVEVKLISRYFRPADLIIIGSHCPGVDLITELGDFEYIKVINIGSVGGWLAVKRGEADIAGTHLFDEQTNEYNIPFMDTYGLRGKAVLIRGYVRLQGFIVEKGNPLNIKSFEDLLKPNIRFINRNKGSGTRALIDMKLRELAFTKNISFQELISMIRGYYTEAKTHSGVAAAIAQGRADVGVAIKSVADAYDLDFIPIGEEFYDFLIPIDRLEKDSVKKFVNVLKSQEFADALQKRLSGYKIHKDTGQIISK
ncbi:MAG: molybdopterin biosynthesis protein [Thermoprotei archaeon]